MVLKAALLKVLKKYTIGSIKNIDKKVPKAYRLNKNDFDIINSQIDKCNSELNIRKCLTNVQLTINKLYKQKGYKPLFKKQQLINYQ